ncbi:MAG: nucleoside hydrolase [Planctomycetia bacterium]|nr:nucleoside hydrolase [Planctomycetia bacterium]
MMAPLKRKVILDIDPGIGDILPLCLALFEPRFHVLGITVCGGHVSPQTALHTIQLILDSLDAGLLPRLGVGHELEPCLFPTARNFWSNTGLDHLDLPAADYFAPHCAEKIISDLVRSHPNEITVVALGPLTNIARAFTREKDLATLVHRLIIVGGTVHEPGNATAAAEYNFYRDPASARHIFRCPVAKTLVPLDITQKLLLDYGILNHIPSKHTKVGEFLQNILPQAFYLHRQYLGMEGIHVPGIVALMALLYPELFESRMLAGDVETEGEITRGMTVFDRRNLAQWNQNIDVLMDVNVPETLEKIEITLEFLQQRME